MSKLDQIFYESKKISTNLFFNLTVSDNHYDSLNRTSFYLDKLPDSDFSIDVGNHKLLANLDEFGKIKQISFYRGTYLTEDKPGTWVSNGFVSEKNIGLDFENIKTNRPIDQNKCTVQFDLLFNIIPRFRHYYGSTEIEVLFVPLISDHEKAISGLAEVIKVYGEKKVKVKYPKSYVNKYSDRSNIQIRTFKSRDSLYTSGWCVISDPNANFNESDNEIESLIQNSFEYYHNYLGNLKIPELPELGALIQRTDMNAVNSIGYDSEGNVVGANWGTAPVVKRTWIRDMFYSSLPALNFDPELIEKVIKWFMKYEVKNHGTKFRGGIQHSVVNSLNSTILYGLYARHWGEKDSKIKQNIVIDNLVKKVNSLIDRVDKDHGLIHSEWISDGLAVGEYHTGTQIVLWRAIKDVENFFRSSLNEDKLAEKYKKIAQMLQKNILDKCTTGANNQKSYLEGCNLKDNVNYISTDIYNKEFVDQGLTFLTRVNDGNKINLHFHDGEESDVTLAPYYGFHNMEDQLYQKSMEYAGTESPTYSKLSKGISWGNESEATFPGYITVLMGHLHDKDAFRRQIIHLFEITDVDGSWWWWPYKRGHGSNDVVRFNKCGKCGWAAGTFNALAITNILGIKIDVNIPKISIDLNSITPSYEWHNFSTSFGRISIKVERQADYDKLTIKKDTNIETPFLVGFTKKHVKKYKKLAIEQKEISILLEG
ncbi:hypothetical protein ACWYVZ_03020 [Pediococcus acidilactici]